MRNLLYFRSASVAVAAACALCLSQAASAASISALDASHITDPIVVDTYTTTLGTTEDIVVDVIVQNTNAVNKGSADDLIYDGFSSFLIGKASGTQISINDSSITTGSPTKTSGSNDVLITGAEILDTSGDIPSSGGPYCVNGVTVLDPGGPAANMTAGSFCYVAVELQVDLLSGATLLTDSKYAAAFTVTTEGAPLGMGDSDIITPDSNSSGSETYDVTVTPEPGSLTLLGTGMLGLAGLIRRKLQRG
jgi:PEP-CTERM motif